MTPHIHIEDARAAIDAVNGELTSWINRTRDAEHEAYLLEDRLSTLGFEHQQLEQAFTDVAANAQWLADIIRSHLAHLPEAREALDASPGASAARLKAQWQEWLWMNDWINAADRLPECDKINEKCVICSDGSRVFEEFAHLVSIGLATGEITHWMPLPAPPSQGGE